VQSAAALRWEADARERQGRRIMISGSRWGLTLSVALVASVYFGAPSFAQKNQVAAFNARIAELNRAGNYSEAIPLAQHLLAEMEKIHGPDHRDVAASLNNLALLHGNQGQDADAEPLNNLASFYRAQGRTTDALPIMERTIDGGRAQLRVALPVLSGVQRQQLMSAEKALDDALDVVQRGAQSSARFRSA
jgi:hypothetical protein